MEHRSNDTIFLLRRTAIVVATFLTCGAVYLSIMRADALIIDLANLVSCL
jgi:hypothetical protein